MLVHSHPIPINFQALLFVSQGVGSGTVILCSSCIIHSLSYRHSVAVHAVSSVIIPYLWSTRETHNDCLCM